MKKLNKASLNLASSNENANDYIQNINKLEFNNLFNLDKPPKKNLQKSSKVVSNNNYLIYQNKHISNNHSSSFLQPNQSRFEK